MRVSSECLLRVCDPVIVVPNSVFSRWISFFILMDSFLGCNRWWIAAAVAAAAAAAFEEAGIFPLCRENDFPMHAGRFYLRFNVVRILRTILVIFHGKLGRFYVLIIEVLFLLAQFLNRNSPSPNCQNSSGNSPKYSMIVLELGDKFWIILAILLVKIDGYIPFFVDLSHGLFGNEIMLLPRLMRFSIKNVSSVREFLISKIFTYVQISSSQGVYIYFWINGCPSMQQSGLSLLLFCMPLYNLLPFLIDCCLCIRNQHCLVWKIFYSYFSVSRSKRPWETDLKNCLNIRNSRFHNIVCVYTSRISMYTRDGAVYVHQKNVRATNECTEMIPFITFESSLCQYVCELVFGVNVFDLDLGVQIDSVR